MRLVFRSLGLIAVFLFSAIPSNAVDGIRSKVIYGQDDRKDYYEVTEWPLQRMADATVALVRAKDLEVSGDQTLLRLTPYGYSNGLCESERFYHQGSIALCSGFLVAPDLIVTAGHCMFSQSQCDNTRFVFGFHIHSPDQTPDSIPSAQVYKCKELVKTTFDVEAADFAVIRLDRSVTYTTPLAVRRMGQLSPGDAVGVIGYPRGLPVKIAGGAYVRSLKPGFFTANTDTFNGNSGSPVYNEVTQEVEGILVDGERDFERINGCLVSKVCEEDKCTGETATRIESVLPFIDSP